MSPASPDHKKELSFSGLGINSAITHNGITDECAMPLSRNRPSSERGPRYKSKDKDNVAVIMKSKPGQRFSRDGVPTDHHEQDKARVQVVRRRPRSDRYVRHKNVHDDSDSERYFMFFYCNTFFVQTYIKHCWNVTMIIVHMFALNLKCDLLL